MKWLTAPVMNSGQYVLANQISSILLDVQDFKMYGLVMNVSIEKERFIQMFHDPCWPLANY